jgi:SSS family solute:Na+ symporter
LLLALTGVAVLGYYQINPPELADGQTLKSAGDKLFPRFIMTEMSGGMAGLVLAAILSAAMSSLSSGVNSAAGVLERDFVSRRTNNSSPEQTVRRLRVLSWLITLLAVALSLLNLLITGNLLERCFKVVNLLTAPLFVLFFLALFIKRSNAAGAWAGLICSVVAAIGIAYGEDLRLPINISFVWMMPISLVVGIFVGTGVSLLTPRTNPA